MRPVLVKSRSHFALHGEQVSNSNPVREATSGPSPSRAQSEGSRKEQLEQFRKLTTRIFNRLCRLIEAKDGALASAELPSDDHIHSLFSSILDAMMGVHLTYYEDEVWHFPELEYHARLSQLKTVSNTDGVGVALERTHNAWQHMLEELGAMAGDGMERLTTNADADAKLREVAAKLEGVGSTLDEVRTTLTQLRSSAAPPAGVTVRKRSRAEPSDSRLEPYRNALKRFWSDGILTSKEKRTLGLLRESMSIRKSEHRTLEREVKRELEIDGGLDETLGEPLARSTAVAALGVGKEAAGEGAELPPPPDAVEASTEPLPPPPGKDTSPVGVGRSSMVARSASTSTSTSTSASASAPVLSPTPTPTSQRRPLSSTPSSSSPSPSSSSASPAPAGMLPGARSRSPTGPIDRAFELLEHGEPERALERFERLLSRMPENGRLHFGKGCALKELGRYNAALDALNTALANGARDGELWFQMGTTLESLKEYEEALGCLERVVRTEPGHARAWYTKARLLAQRRGDLEGSVEALDRVIALLPENEKALMYKGIVLKKLGRTRQALEHFERVLQINPQNRYAIRCKRSTESDLKEQQDQMRVADKAVRCGICMGYIKKGWTVVKCSCSKTYHEACSKRVKKCPYCNREF